MAVLHAVGFLQWGVESLVEGLEVEGLGRLGLGFENIRIGFDRY
jgi:hypothetical protein